MLEKEYLEWFKNNAEYVNGYKNTNFNQKYYRAVTLRYCHEFVDPQFKPGGKLHEMFRVYKATKK